MNDDFHEYDLSDDKSGDATPNPVEQSEKQGIRPGFLGGGGGGDIPSGLKSNNNRREEAKKTLGSVEKSARSGVSKVGAIKGGVIGAGASIFSGSGRPGKISKGSGKGGLMKYAAGGMILIVLLFVVIGVVLSAPVFLIATIDYNLQDSLGFSETVAVLEEQAEHVTASMLKKGRVPDGFADDLAKNGLEVGQVTAGGGFVRTNVYVAELNDAEVASNGRYEFRTEEEGTLAILFEGELVGADQFVDKVESNPIMYAQFARASDISARFYYSDEVNKVYKDMGVSRGNFYNWEPTGDAVSDQESFNDTLSKMLDTDSNLNVGGCDDECGNGAEITIKPDDDAGDKVTEVSNKIKDNNTNTATVKAANLLNAAISSNEPYKAAQSFIAVEEPIQKARIGDNGPVNEMMNVLSVESELTYTDVNSGEVVTKKNSILSTPNFAAAVSKGSYSIDEANNFSRDRVIKVTNANSSGVINDTTVSSENNKKSSAVLGMGVDTLADNNELQKATSSVAIAATTKNSELFRGETGGNRVVEGGSFISNTINMRTIGAMPSDEGAIAEYRHVSKEALARKAAAERATRSPFDISSPYTFLGSIMHGMARAYVRSYSGSESSLSVGSLAGVIVGATGDAVSNLWGGAIADGDDDTSFTTLSGECYTAPTAANVEGDLYCNPHNTVATNFMNYDEDDWANVLGGDLENGKIKKDSNFEEFVVLGVDRESTVGVKSADVCETYRSRHKNVLSSITGAFSKMFGVYQSCKESAIGIDGVPIDGVPADISTGSKYTMSSSNGEKDMVEKYSGYMLFDTVNSLLSQKKSSVSIFREEYYAKYPKDDSAVGVVARRSGMSREQAEIALNYANELTRIANYVPAERFMFGRGVISQKEKNILVEHSEDLQLTLLGVWGKKTEYGDNRGRNFVA